MTTERGARLTHRELAIKLACRDAVKAAGGQDFVATEVGRCQSVVSDWCSPNTRSFMPADVIARVEALGHGQPGSPHVTRALARAQGLLVADAEPEEAAGATLAGWLATVAHESSDLIRALAAGAVMPGLARQGFTKLSALERRTIASELDQLIDVLAGLNGIIGEGGDTS
jgi:hypothetical protein